MIKRYSLNAVTITDEALENVYRKAQEFVRSIEPDRLIVKFQETAGIPKKTEPYTEGWECYMTGYYLTAVAQLYEATHAKDLKDRLEYVVEQFVECQAYDGYLFSGEGASGQSSVPEQSGSHGWRWGSAGGSTGSRSQTGHPSSRMVYHCL